MLPCFEPYHGILPLSEKLHCQSITPNSDILNSATIGLKFLYQKIRTRVNNRAVDNVCGGHYRLEAEIARGTFSSVYSGEDLYSFDTKKYVALKIVNTGCEVLANREKLILDHINYGLEKPLFMVCKDMIMLPSKKLCLVFPLYQATLINCLNTRAQSMHNYHHLFDRYNVPHNMNPPKSNADWYNSIPVSGNGAQTQKAFLPSPQVQSVQNMQNTTTMTTPMGHSHYSWNSDITTSETFDSTTPLATAFTTEDLKALKRIAFTLLLGLLKLQQEGIIHGDIKPENCFIATTTHEKDSAVFKLCEDDNSSIYSTSSFTNSNPLVDMKKWGKSAVTIGSLAHENSQVVLGDFGSSFHHHTELAAHCIQFDVQSLPYRAPEVLVGLPFTNSIDVWSVGVLLMELTLQHLWFICGSRKEAMILISHYIQPFEKTAFSGGKYFDLLNEIDRDFGWTTATAGSSSSAESTEERTTSRLTVMRSLCQIIQKRFVDIPIPSYAFNEWVNFLSGLLQVHAKHRMTVQEALQHRIFTSNGSSSSTWYSIPPSLAAHLYSLKQNDKQEHRSSKKVKHFRKQLASHVENAAMKRKLWQKQQRRERTMGMSTTISTGKDISVLEHKNKPVPSSSSSSSGHDPKHSYSSIMHDGEREMPSKRFKGNTEQQQHITMTVPLSSSSSTTFDIASSIPIAPKPKAPVPLPIPPVPIPMPAPTTSAITAPNTEVIPPVIEFKQIRITTTPTTVPTTAPIITVPLSNPNRRQARKDALNSLPQSALFPT